MAYLRALLASLRPHQWVKNLFVIAPLVFSRRLLILDDALGASGAFGLFCFLSGAVYLINDLFDIDRDRAHPTKRNRPIASGRLSASLARSAAATLIVGTLSLALFYGLTFFALASTYLILNLAYSLYLKQVPFLDVITIACGFLLRVAAGSAAIFVSPSPWLLACTFLLASFLGYGKRFHELATSSEAVHAIKQRPVLARYRKRILIVVLWIVGLLTCLAYTLYTFSPHTLALFGHRRLPWTIPFAVIGILRFLRIVNRADPGLSPTDAMLKDKFFLLNIAGWAISIVVLLYTPQGG